MRQQAVSLRLLGYQGRPSVVQDSKQSASDYWAIRAGPQWYKTASSQPQTTGLSGQALSGTRQQAVSLRLLGYQGRPSVVRDSKQSATDYWAVRAGPQW